MGLLSEVLERRESDRAEFIEREIRFITGYLSMPDTRTASTIFPEVADHFSSSHFRVESDDRGYRIFPERG